MTRSYTYQETIILHELECANCGIMFAAPQKWIETKQKEGGSLSCPNGHTLTYGGNTLQKQLTAEQERYRELEMQLTSTQDQLEASKRELQRHKKRVANGVCPCCNRSFVQLQRHMKTKHPEYDVK